MLERTLSLAHPLMPFVTEEIWGYLPDRATDLIVAPFPEADPSRFDEAAEAELGAVVESVRELRRWRELAGVAPAATLSARVADPTVARLARLVPAEDGETVATVGSVDVLASPELDADAVGARLDERRRSLESEVRRAEGKLANEGFVAKAPAEVVEAEREKLGRYRAELEELSA